MLGKWLLLLLPGGSAILGLMVALGIGMGPHAANITDGVDIFSNVPYKQQHFNKKHPGECYDPSNTYPNGDKIVESPKYGVCAKKHWWQHKHNKRHHKVHKRGRHN